MTLEILKKEAERIYKNFPIFEVDKNPFFILAYEFQMGCAFSWYKPIKKHFAKSSVTNEVTSVFIYTLCFLHFYYVTLSCYFEILAPMSQFTLM